MLAQTNVYEDGTEEDVLIPMQICSLMQSDMTLMEKADWNREANFQLLTSHEFFLNQMKNEFKNQKNTGDSVITTLNADLQSTAYNALGDRRGAVVAIEPSTGKILVEMSRPDFDPNTISQNWDTLVNDSNDSSLLNRATNGAYPPGSTFKVVTALDYFRTKAVWRDFPISAKEVLPEKITRSGAMAELFMDRKIFTVLLPIPVTVHLQRSEPCSEAVL